MKRTTRITIAAVATGLLGVGAAAAVTPALAGGGPADQPSAAAGNQPMGNANGAGDCDHSSASKGHGNGQGGKGQGARGHGNGQGMQGQHQQPTDLASGTLTDQQKATLATMAQDEKAAHDLYQAFADKYDLQVFDRIAASENRHLESVRALLDRYGLTDPTKDTATGKFTDQQIQAAYDRLLAQGSADQAAALAAGQEFEKIDIAGLKEASAGMTAPDVKQLYQNLLQASEHHLSAFSNGGAR